ncbi:VWA domain-containing protein [Brevibacterium aurantiacum]|uniref:VWA domain-containing protein n=1 Tax=Brevibacterium aurantiacum TaxID=273384 RepID=A0A556C6P4_BREAU|nr:VWA domain-containing protein [Brevibacterium aurantiacum]TSI13127.1 VWA domain-containing protein [Brevibacterium aurantiacum]
MSDLTAELMRFGSRLRRHGLPAGADRIRTLASALAHIDLLDPTQVRAASRSLICTEQKHIPIHDALFNQHFGLTGRQRVAPGPHEVSIPTPEPSEESSDSAKWDHVEDQTMALQAAASRLEVLRTTDLGNGEHAAEAVRLIDGLSFRNPRRSAYADRRSSFGRIDANQIVRTLLRQEELSRLPRSTRRERDRDVTIIVDVSASMKQWLPALIRFLARATPRLKARSFTLGTRLTRVDHHFSAPLNDRELLAAQEAIPDLASGTRLGEGLLTLLNGGHREAIRGSVLVLISDGWEQGDCSELRRACARLGRLSHRFIWVNPRAGRVGFTPEVRGMRIAEEHAQVMLPATTVDGWQAVAENIASSVRRDTARQGRGGTSKDGLSRHPDTASAGQRAVKETMTNG